MKDKFFSLFSSLNAIIVIVVNLSFLQYTFSYYIAHGEHSNLTLNNFSFGSCWRGFLSYRYDLFNMINKNDPQLWLWLGDSAYIHPKGFFLPPILYTEIATKLYKDNLEDPCIYIYKFY